ncbi:hypothetical protein BB018_03325 [Neisseria gonorrhoeae]|nr:hypothetical protein BB018_03325 [Neisseria gonorrhoeae]
MGIRFFEFQSFPINCLSIECLDSRLRGNDAFHLPPPSRKTQKNAVRRPFGRHLRKNRPRRRVRRRLRASLSV